MPYVLIHFVVADVLNAVVEKYANMIGTRIGVSPVVARMYANTIRFDHSVWLVGVISSALIRNAEAFVGSARASICALTRCRRTYVRTVKGRPFANMVGYVMYAWTVKDRPFVSTIKCASYAFNVRGALFVNIVGCVASVWTVKGCPFANMVRYATPVSLVMDLGYVSTTKYAALVSSVIQLSHVSTVSTSTSAYPAGNLIASAVTVSSILTIPSPAASASKNTTL